MQRLAFLLPLSTFGAQWMQTATPDPAQDTTVRLELRLMCGETIDIPGGNDIQISPDKTIWWLKEVLNSVERDFTHEFVSGAELQADEVLLHTLIEKPDFERPVLQLQVFKYQAESFEFVPEEDAERRKAVIDGMFLTMSNHIGHTFRVSKIDAATPLFSPLGEYPTDVQLIEALEIFLGYARLTEDRWGAYDRLQMWAPFLAMYSDNFVVRIRARQIHELFYPPLVPKIEPGRTPPTADDFFAIWAFMEHVERSLRENQRQHQGPRLPDNATEIIREYCKQNNVTPPASFTLSGCFP